MGYPEHQLDKLGLYILPIFHIVQPFHFCFQLVCMGYPGHRLDQFVVWEYKKKNLLSIIDKDLLLQIHMYICHFLLHDIGNSILNEIQLKKELEVSIFCHRTT